MRSIRKTNRRARRNAHQARIRAIRLATGYFQTWAFLKTPADEIARQIVGALARPMGISYEQLTDGRSAG